MPQCKLECANRMHQRSISAPKDHLSVEEHPLYGFVVEELSKKHPPLNPVEVDGIVTDEGTIILVPNGKFAFDMLDANRIARKLEDSGYYAAYCKPDKRDFSGAFIVCWDPAVIAKENGLDIDKATSLKNPCLACAVKNTNKSSCQGCKKRDVYEKFFGLEHKS